MEELFLGQESVTPSSLLLAAGDHKIKLESLVSRLGKEP
jgi:hypothetical protein